MNDSTSGSLWAWLLFNAFILLLLYADLRVFHKEDKLVSVKQALAWSAGWIGLALMFDLLIWSQLGSDRAVTFLAGYLIEKSLSVDNLFVFLMIFSTFHVLPKFQHKILFYGILGALVMRCVFIYAGVALLQKFHWLIYLMGAFLIVSGLKIFIKKSDDDEPGPIIKYFNKWLGPAREEEGGDFWKKSGNWYAPTRLFWVLILVEITDLVFALDSIPAVLAISNDPFIIYSSNVFAILGLRSLFFALAGLMRLFNYLDYGISVILAFVGLKMVCSGFFHIPEWFTLFFIGSSLTIAIWVSIKTHKGAKETEEAA